MPSLRRFCESCTGVFSSGRMTNYASTRVHNITGKQPCLTARPIMYGLLGVLLCLACLPTTDADGQILIWSQQSHRWTKLRGIFGPPSQWLSNQVKKYYTSESVRDKIYNHLAYDHQERFVYWHDAQERSIFRQPINDSLVKRRTDNVEIVFEGMSEDIGGIAVDWLSGTVYWTDNTLNRILATRWHPTRKDMYFVVQSESIDEPTGIAVDPVNGVLYWADKGASIKAIRSSHLDGTNVQFLTNVDDVEDVTSLTLDLTDNRLYFLQRGPSTSGKQRVSRLDVVTLELVNILNLDQTHYAAIAAHGDYVFLANSVDLQIETFSKGGLMLHSYVIDAIPRGLVVTAKLDPQLTPPTDCDTLGCGDFCISMGNGRAECRCQDDHYFQLDERSCVSSSPRYIYSIDGSLWDAKATISNAPPKVVLKESEIDQTKMKIQAIGYHFIKNRVYFSDTELNDIYRGNPDSRIFEKHTVNQFQVEGLSVNWLSETLYWSDVELRHIMVSQFDGRYHSILLKDVGQPRGIAVDPIHGYLFFVNAVSPPTLERTSTDGRDRKVILSKDLVQPQSVVVDPRTKRIYWTDISEEEVFSCDLEGENCYSAQSALGPNLYGVTLYQSFLTWTESNVIPQFGIAKGNRIVDVMSNIDHSLLLTAFNVRPAQTYAVVSYNQYLQPSLRGPCVDNGDCQQLCFPTPEGHTCGCAIGYKLNPDGKACDTGGNVARNWPAMLESTFALFLDPYHKALYQLESVDPWSVRAVPVALMDFPVSFDLDPLTGKVYWIDRKQKVIKGSYTDGSDETTVWSWDRLTDRDPSHLIYNRDDEYLYFTDQGLGRAGIYRIGKGGGALTSVVRGLVKPAALTSDFSNKLYYVDPGNKPNEARVGMVRTDGSDHVQLVSKGLAEPVAITYLVDDNLVLWADRSSGSVHSYNVTTGVQTLVFSDPSKEIISLAADNFNIYFTAHHHKSVFVAEYGVPNPTIKEITSPIFARIFDIKAYPDIILVPPVGAVTTPGIPMLFLGVGIAAAVLLALLLIILALCLLKRRRHPKGGAAGGAGGPDDPTYDEVEREYIGMNNPTLTDTRGGPGHVPNGHMVAPGHGYSHGHAHSRSQGYGRESLETIDIELGNGHTPAQPEVPPPMTNGHGQGHAYGNGYAQAGSPSHGGVDSMNPGESGTLAMAAVAVASGGGLKKTKHHRKYTQKNRMDPNGFELSGGNGKVATVIQRLASRLRTGISSIRWTGDDDGKSSRRSKRSSRPPSDNELDVEPQNDDIDPDKRRFQKRPPIGPAKPQLHRLPQGFSPASRVTPSAVKATWGRNKKKMMGKNRPDQDQQN